MIIVVKMDLFVVEIDNNSLINLSEVAFVMNRLKINLISLFTDFWRLERRYDGSFM
jgi:hypothetical protein